MAEVRSTTCERHREALLLHAHGALAATQCFGAMLHRASCRPCRARWRSRRTIGQALRTAGYVGPNAAFVRKVAEAVAQERQNPPRPQSQNPFTRRAAMSLVFGTLLLGAGARSTWNVRALALSPTPRLRAHAQPRKHHGSDCDVPLPRHTPAADEIIRQRSGGSGAPGG